MPAKEANDDLDTASSLGQNWWSTHNMHKEMYSSCSLQYLEVPAGQVLQMCGLLMVLPYD